VITLEANYSKKIGLPGYSSHQFSITLTTELSDVSQVQQESARLYRLLQDGVDESIQQIGFLPGQTNGNGNGHSGSNSHQNGNGNSDVWKCSPKQKELVLKIVDENRLDKTEIEQLARERFNTPVKLLNKLQASGLIKELLEKYPGKENGNNRRFQKAGSR
jgi:competence protein ComGF